LLLAASYLVAKPFPRLSALGYREAFDSSSYGEDKMLPDACHTSNNSKL
jgi:hypothetical protein